jgi:hypothetical protein
VCVLAQCPHERQRYAERVIDETSADPGERQRMIDNLRELIVALDRRVPRLEATGEIDIASDAAKLRDKALERIAELEAGGR